MNRVWGGWWDLAADSWRLGLQAQTVVGLRLAKLAVGDAAAAVETQRMVAEKMTAAMEAQVAATTAILSGRSDLAPKRALAVYQRKVGANRRRLSRRSR
jgi:hypothetical protein